MKYFKWEESLILICENELFEANLKKQDIGQSRTLLDTVAMCVNVHILGTQVTCRLFTTDFNSILLSKCINPPLHSYYCLVFFLLYLYFALYFLIF